MDIDQIRVKDLTTKELQSLIRQVVTQTMTDFLNQRVSQDSNQQEILVTETRIVEPEAINPDTFAESEVVKEKTPHPHIPVKEVAKDLGLYWE